MIKWFKISVIGLGGLIFLIMLLVISSLYYLQTGHAQKIIQEKINDTIPGKVAWDSLSFSISAGRLELKNVLLKAPDQKDLLGFKRLYLDLDLKRLANKELVVDELTIEAPEIDLRFDKNGRLNLLDAFSAPAEEKQQEPEVDKKESNDMSFNVIVKKMQIIDGSALYKTAKEELELDVGDFDIIISGNLFSQNGDISIQIAQVRLASPQADSLLEKATMNAALKNGEVKSAELNLHTQDSTVSLFGDIKNIFDNPDLDLKLNLFLSLAELKETLKLEQALSGTVETSVSAKGTTGNPAVKMKMVYSGGVLADNKIDSVKLKMQLEDRLLDIQKLAVLIAGGQINLEGSADLREAFPKGFFNNEQNLAALAYDINVKEQGVALEKLIQPENSLKGRLKTTLEIRGKGISPKTMAAEAAIKISGQIQSNGEAVPVEVHITANAALANGTAVLNTLSASAGEIELNSNGQFDLNSQNIKAKLDLNAPDLSKNLSALGMNDIMGSLSLKADASGSVKSPVFDVRVSGDDLAFKEITIGDIALKANLNKGMVRISPLKVTNNQSDLKVTGTVKVLEDDMAKPLADPIFDLDIKASEIFIEDFIDTIKGRFVIDAKMAGSSTKPEGTFVLTGDDIDLGVQKIKSIEITSHSQANEMILDKLSIGINDKESLDCTGRFIFPNSYEIELVSKQISLSSIEKVQEQNIADGEISLFLSGKGSLDNPAINGKIVIRDLLINQNKMDDFIINVDVTDHLARVQGNLNFDIDADYHIKTQDFHSTVTFQETDLNPYFQIAGQKDLNGKITGTISASGNAKKPHELEVQAKFGHFDVFFEGKELLVAQNTSLGLADEDFSISHLQLNLPEKGLLDLKGGGSLKGPLEINIAGKIPVSVADIFMEDIDEARGKIIIDARVKGTLPEPEIQANIDFQDIGMIVPGLMQKLHALNGTISVMPEHVTFRNVQGNLDSGKFTLAGEVGLEKFQPVKIDVKLTAGKLPVEVPDTLDMLLDSEIQIKGDANKSVVKGELVILKGNFYKEIELNLLDAVGKKRAVSPPPTEMKNPFLKNMELNIHVKRRNPFLVDNNLAYLDINPDLQIRGKLNNPSISGRVEIVSGNILYQKNSFTVKKGVIDFLNPYKIEPTLDLESEVDIRDWKIFLGIAGTPDAIEFKLSSEPPEEDGDIISLLLTGMTTRELISGEGGSSQSPSQVLNGMIAATLGDNVKNATGLDVFELEGAGSDNVKVTIGKELSRRMMVKYSTETKDGENIQKAVGEYKFMDNILLNGFQDTTGVFGGEVQFRMEFR